MMESIEKLRGLPFHDTKGFGNCVTASKKTISSIADEIEREIAERYMELPVDADGVPIRVGDMLECHANGYDGKLDVFAVGIDVVIGNHNSEFVMHHPAGYFHVARYCHHVKPRTLEDVLEEFVHEWNDTHSDDMPALKARYAAEIRELMEVDE